MKQRIYKILIVVLWILILISINIFYNISDKNKKIEASSQPIEENNIDNNINNQSTKEVDSSTTDWNLTLINKNNYIPENYELNLVKIEENYKVDYRIKEAAQQMLTDARNAGLEPVICSAYRSSNQQKSLFDKKVKEYKRKGYSQTNAEQQASLWVTIPGTSEHEIGLALDIVEKEYQVLDKEQENTDVQKWLMEHCYEYGFILRYPTEKKDITKINYEPWHYRYVGVKDAMLIKEKGFCLEEYIEYLKNIE